jgi:hypothetical protein
MRGFGGGSDGSRISGSVDKAGSQGRVQVSNKKTMSRPKLLLCWLLLSACSGAQAPAQEPVSLDRARKSMVSALDPGLPQVSLEFFLNYESGGALVGWQRVDCPNGTVMQHASRPTCVEADFRRADGASVALVVSVPAPGAQKTAVRFEHATITFWGGLSRSVKRLGDLPMELQRPAPKGPRDASDSTDA